MDAVGETTRLVVDGMWPYVRCSTKIDGEPLDGMILDDAYKIM